MIQLQHESSANIYKQRQWINLCNSTADSQRTPTFRTGVNLLSKLQGKTNQRASSLFCFCFKCMYIYFRFYHTITCNSIEQPHSGAIYSQCAFWMAATSLPTFKKKTKKSHQQTAVSPSSVECVKCSSASSYMVFGGLRQKKKRGSLYFEMY